jgi:hypothetical protein
VSNLSTVAELRTFDGNSLSAVSLTLVNNFSAVSLTPAIKLFPNVVDTGQK